MHFSFSLFLLFFLVLPLNNDYHFNTFSISLLSLNCTYPFLIFYYNLSLSLSLTFYCLITFLSFCNLSLSIYLSIYLSISLSVNINVTHHLSCLLHSFSLSITLLHNHFQMTTASTHSRSPYYHLTARIPFSFSVAISLSLTFCCFITSLFFVISLSLSLSLYL